MTVLTPELYYTSAWDHFAVRCGAVVFHGSIGTVYPTDRGRTQCVPKWVKECHFRGRCSSLKKVGKGPPCSYYYDPEECPDAGVGPGTCATISPTCGFTSP